MATLSTTELTKLFDQLNGIVKDLSTFVGQKVSKAEAQQADVLWQQSLAQVETAQTALQANLENISTKINILIDRVNNLAKYHGVGPDIEPL